MREKENEEWRPVKGYKEKYAISNFGRLKTLTRVVKEHRRCYIRQGKIMNKYNNNEGYYRVKLYNGDGSFKNEGVHRLVAQAFLNNPNNYSEVNHKDGNPSNNHVDNIEWCSKEQNVEHAYRTGLKKKENYVGEACTFSKLNEEDVLSIRDEYATGLTSYNKLARKYNVVMSNIQSIIKRKTWAHV